LKSFRADCHFPITIALASVEQSTSRHRESVPLAAAWKGAGSSLVREATHERQVHYRSFAVGNIASAGRYGGPQHR
ncbi:hypothetical protein, partial [Vibrio alginolyticus]|uniref:hypothetical protein n=1 Tax=Vibrio alginolyticus TaxID=663 RepID=UPI001A905D8F